MKNRIAQLRKERSLTLKQLGQDLKIRDSTLSQYETGKRIPQLGVWIEIADYFGVSLEYLLYKTSKRDYKFKTDDDAVALLKRIGDNELHYDDLSRETTIDLAFWLFKNADYFMSGEKYHKYASDAMTFRSTFNSENKAFEWFSKSRKESFDTTNKIINELENEEYYGASPKQVLEFIEISKNLELKDINKLLKDAKAKTNK